MHIIVVWQFRLHSQSYERVNEALTIICLYLGLKLIKDIVLESRSLLEIWDAETLHVCYFNFMSQKCEQIARWRRECVTSHLPCFPFYCSPFFFVVFLFFFFGLSFFFSTQYMPHLRVWAIYWTKWTLYPTLEINVTVGKPTADGHTQEERPYLQCQVSRPATSILAASMPRKKRR